jgi:uncharacterized Tic20 family protein
MSDADIRQDERVLAALAHGSIALGVLTNGIGGIGVALAIWLTQQHKSTHVARQALQALVYQVAAAVIGLLAWCCWGVLWLLMLIASIGSGATADPPAAVWVGLALMIIPAGIMGLTVLYGLWGAVRSLKGHDFKYAIIGSWLETL